MHSKMAGHLPLSMMITSVIDRARTQMDESKSKTASAAPKKEPVKEQVKTASPLIDFRDPEEIEKLASALVEGAEALVKVADTIENGGESRQGGMQLPTQSPTSGRQSYKKDGSKKHSPPMSTGLQASSDGNGATQVPNDATKAPGGSAYPAKGVMKTAADGGVMAMIAKKKEGKGEEKSEKKDDEKDDKKKESSALNFLLSKMAESAQGGMTLDSASGQGPKPSNDAKGGNSARSAIESNSAATNMKKVDGKAPQKRMLSEVLTEPAMSSSTDNKVGQNLRNASKGGVKIAAARALFQKVAADASHPLHGKLKEALAKKKEKDAAGMGASAPMATGSGIPPMTGM